MLTQSQKNYALFNAALKLIRKQRWEEGRVTSVYRDRFYNKSGTAPLSVKVESLYVFQEDFLANFADRYTGRFIFNIPLGKTKFPLTKELKDQIKVLEVTARLDGGIRRE